MNAPVTRIADGLPRRAFTNEDVRKMTEVGIFDEDEPIELIKGEIVPMAPELDTHMRPRALLTRVFNRALSDQWVVASEGSLFLSEDLELKPDLHVFPRTMRSEDVRGGDVLLVVEVAATSQHRDFVVKVPIYAQAGVRELWVLDVDARRASIFTDPRDGAYASRVDLDADAPLSPQALPEVRVRLIDLV